MALIYKGVTIPAGANITYKGTALQKIIYKGVVVWQKYVAATATIAGGPSTAYGGGSGQPTYGDGNILLPQWNYSLSSISADAVIAWDGVRIKAKSPCEVTVSGAIRAQDVDNYPCAVKVFLFKNDSSVATFLNTTIAKGETKDFSLPAKTVTLAAGETCSIRVGGGHSDYSNSRTRFFIINPIRFVATPV